MTYTSMTPAMGTTCITGRDPILRNRSQSIGL